MQDLKQERKDLYPSAQISANHSPFYIIVGERKETATVEETVQRQVEELLQSLKINIHDPNFEETPRRLTSYLLEHFIPQSEVEEVLADCQRAVFPNQYGGMVVAREIKINGMCPHHLLPVNYSVDIAYIPDKNAIGLSKLHRLAEVYGKQPVMQETFTSVLADELERILQTENVACVVRGEHQCMQIRGVKSQDAFVYTAELRGAYLNDPDVKEELYQILKMR